MKFLQYVGIAAVATTVDAFTPSIPSYLSSVTIPQQQRIQSPTFLRMSSSTLPEAKSMRVGELKKELDSYRISTKSFFEKSELVDAVEKARAKGTTPKTDKIKDDDSSSSTPSESSGSREESLEKEMENCKSMKAGDLKKELESYGINTKSFFEKSEFVKACAEARVDGVTKKADSGGEGYAEYADVEVLTDDTSGPRKRSSEQQSQGQSQSSNPFGGGMEGMGGGGGGGSNPFGGGGMGGIADMMKNMGGGGGGMPGGMPGGGDQMKKAQEMMSNPKVREIIMKAQSNPKIMKAVQECMSNPMAFAKYQNDPEVGELIRELQTFM
jgi:hypothetical protein